MIIGMEWSVHMYASMHYVLCSVQVHFYSVAEITARRLEFTNEFFFDHRSECDKLGYN